MSFLSEFKVFAAKGNVVDLAVGVIIGATFGKIVDSLVKDLIMPVVGQIFGGLDFSNDFVRLADPPSGYGGPMTYEALTKAGVPLFAYGNFITVALNFVILAFIIFVMVKQINRLKREELPPRRRQPRRLPPRMFCCCARSATRCASSARSPGAGVTHRTGDAVDLGGYLPGRAAAGVAPRGRLHAISS